MKKKKKLSKGAFSKIIVIFCIAFITIYTIVNLLLFVFFQAEPEALHQYVFGFYGGELLLVCLKRIFGNKYDNNKQETTNTDEASG